MPRGTRALYQVAGVGAEADAPTHSACLVEKLLPCQCWCTRGFVLVHRNDILDGNTGSCGLRSCAPPDGETLPAPSVCISLGNRSSWKIKAEDSKARFDDRYVDRTGVDDNLVLLARRGRFIPRPRTYPPHVKVRRDFVATMFEQRKHPIDIALVLNIPVVVVRDDLVQLRQQRRIA